MALTATKAVGLFVYKPIYSMFNFWPFKKPKRTPPVFIIDEYPLSRSFYVRESKGGRYLRRDSYSGIIRLEYDIIFATQCESIEDADLLINQYKEQNYLTTYKQHRR